MQMRKLVPKSVRRLRRWLMYWRDYWRYQRMPDAERLHWRDRVVCLGDEGATTQVDPHYFYQATWAAERIRRSGVASHVDVGSDNRFVGMLAAYLTVTFLDLRPLPVQLPSLRNVAADILRLPLRDRSLASLSCLHVAEHIGLGRYGDPLDPQGTRRACAELRRVLAPGGNLLFSVPLGRPRVCFNGHRISSLAQIRAHFAELTLMEFSLVDDAGQLIREANPVLTENVRYGCGLFWFRRQERTP